MSSAGDRPNLPKSAGRSGFRGIACSLSWRRSSAANELEGLKTVADAAYIRRLSRNVGNGYAQKWRLYSDPGGNAPLGFARVAAHMVAGPIRSFT